MRIELDEVKNERINEQEQGTIVLPKEDSLGDKENRKLAKAARREKLKELGFKGKVQYFMDYYKWPTIVTILVAIALAVFIRDFRENRRPTYLDVEFINSFFMGDTTNTVYDDFVKEYNVDLDTYKLYIGTDMTLAVGDMNQYNVGNQQRLVAQYVAKEIDVVIAPVEIIEGPANCDCYADISTIIPKDLMDELIEREYEIYYFDPKVNIVEGAEDYYDEEELKEQEALEPYPAGIYLDNCSYLNNNGEYGAYPLATEEKDRPVFTFSATSQHPEHAVEFLRFLIHNR